MILSFRHRGLERFFLKGTRAGIQASQEKRIRLILARLNAARSPQDMNLPGLYLHPPPPLEGLEEKYLVGSRYR